MEVRNLKHDDYNTLVEWWKFWRFPAPAREILPNNALDGYKITDKGVDICAGFIYRTSSPYLWWIEFIVANPKVRDRELREMSIIALLNYMSEVVKSLGGKVIYSSIKHENLIKHYEKSGFKKGTIGATEMIKSI